MKIVIGGANGLIGKQLTRALASRGDEVVQLVRAVRGPQASGGITQVLWDGRSSGPWIAQLEGADAVINLAGANVGERRWSEARKREILSSRIDSTRVLVSAMRAASLRPRAFISASAVGFYGPRGDEPIDEGTGAGSDYLAQVCAAWEAEAKTAEALCVRCVQMRTGIVLARRGQGSALDQLILPFKLFVGGHVGSGKQWFPWIHLEDEVAAFLWTLDHDVLSGPVNAVSPGIVTMQEFCAQLGRALHRPSWMPVPAFALRAAVGQFSEALLTGQRAVPSRLIESGFQFRFSDLPRALAALLG